MSQGHRIIEIAWLPASTKGWTTFSAVRIEAARLWNDLCDAHADHRQKYHEDKAHKFPTLGEWEKWAKGKYPALSAKSVQQILGEFLEACRSTLRKREEERKKGLPEGQKPAEFPWRHLRHRDVPFTNQGARIRNGFLILPCGKSGELSIRLPDGMRMPEGRLMEARLAYNRILLVFSDQPKESLADRRARQKAEKDAAKQALSRKPTVGVDLGINSVIAATDGHKAIVISGRAIKANIQYREKRGATLRAHLSSKTKGSRRYKRAKRRGYAMRDKTRRRIKDLCHKATRKVVEAFPDAGMVVGKPFNDAAKKARRTQAQLISQACTRRIIGQLQYKARSCRDRSEAYSSQTCPVCGCLRKCGRTYRCRNPRCQYSAPRDVVGALNILQLGREGAMSPQPEIATRPMVVSFVRPTKYLAAMPVVRADTSQVAQSHL